LTLYHCVLMKKLFSLLATLLVLALAIWIGRSLWVHYMETPWTRDGRVRADIINVAADVTGEVVNVPVRDNQLVKKGDLLMQIDPSTTALRSNRRKAWWHRARQPGRCARSTPTVAPTWTTW
jgi:multidrug resistance efflux pump